MSTPTDKIDAKDVAAMPGEHCRTKEKRAVDAFRIQEFGLEIPDPTEGRRYL